MHSQPSTQMLRPGNVILFHLPTQSERPEVELGMVLSLWRSVKNPQLHTGPTPISACSTLRVVALEVASEDKGSKELNTLACLCNFLFLKSFVFLCWLFIAQISLENYGKLIIVALPFPRATSKSGLAVLRQLRGLCVWKLSFACWMSLPVSWKQIRTSTKDFGRFW